MLIGATYRWVEGDARGRSDSHGNLVTPHREVAAMVINLLNLDLQIDC